MKKHFLFFLAIMIFAACKKEQQVPVESKSAEQTWYEKQAQALPADWSAAERLPGYLLVPLTGGPEQGFRKLAILNNADGGFTVRVIELLPDIAYWQQKQAVKTSDFTGRVMIFNDQYGLMGGGSTGDGRQVGEIRPQAKAEAGGEQIKTNLAEVVESCAWYDRSYVDAEGVLTVFSERVCTYAVYDNGFYPDTGTGGPVGGDPLAGGGGGGGGNAGAPPVANLPGEDQQKVNPKSYMNCFATLPDQGAKYKVTVFVQEPQAGLPFNLGSNSVGHTAIGMTKIVNGQSITQVVGFYPDASGKDKLHAPSKLIDNAGLDYTISASYDIQAFEFRAIVSFVSDPPSTYDLYRYNCTNFVYDAMKAGNVILPNPIGNMGMFQSGMTPSALGGSLRDASSVLNSNINGGVIDKTHGPCN